MRKTIEEYEVPVGLPVKPEQYRDWLWGRAQSLHARDRKDKRVKIRVKANHYYAAIDRAVQLALKKKDFYTGESLGWGKLGKQELKKKRDADYPTVDHVDPKKKNRIKPPVFVICRDDTNKMKSDLKLEKFHWKAKRIRVRGLMTTGIALRRAQK